MNTNEITTEAIGQISETVLMDGIEIGTVFENMASPNGARGSYRFADRNAAIAACVSYATKGYWTSEIS